MILSMMGKIKIIAKIHKINQKYQQKTQIIILKCTQTTILAVEVITTTHRQRVVECERFNKEITSANLA